MKSAALIKLLLPVMPLLLLLIACLFMPRMSGGAVMGPFGFLDDTISKGNAQSYDGRRNPPSNRDFTLGASQTEHPPMTYFGNNIPLLERPPGPIENPIELPQHHNPKCSLSCCPSPYSCDKGCYCMTLDSYKKSTQPQSK